MTASEGFPADLVDFELTAGAVSVVVDRGLYPLEAVYGAAYVFLDRCWVLLDRPASERVRVTLTAKRPTTEAALRALVGDLQNELLSCAWRLKITHDARSTLEAVTAQALAGARGAPTVDDLARFDFSDDAFDDPLGIATSWEEKYQKENGPSGEGGAR